MANYITHNGYKISPISCVGTLMGATTEWQGERITWCLDNYLKFTAAKSYGALERES